MTDTDLKILELLSNKRHPSLTTLKKETGLNSYQLALKLNNLKNSGFLIERIYFSDNIRYCLHKDPNKKTYLHMNVHDKFRFIAIADTHIGSKFERIDLLDNIYAYATKEGIHTIIHCGDLMEGPNLNEINSLKMINEALKCIIKNYPKDDSINNYITFGNHDARSIVQNGYNIESFLSTKRLDFICMGYKFGYFKTLNDFIAIYHPYYHSSCNQYVEDVYNKFPSIDPKLILLGHTHKSSFSISEKNIVVNVPCLCSTNTPGAWDITINYDTITKKIENIILKKLAVDPIIYTIDELCANVKIKEFC